MYSYVSTLGEGAYAIVVKAKSKDGSYVAIKKPFHPSSQKKNIPGIVAFKELQIMATIRHPHIMTASSVKFVDPCKTPLDKMSGRIFDQIFYVMPLANYCLFKWKGSLANRIKGCFDIAKAVEYIHCLGISHRDIKPENIIIFKENKSFVFKLCDFGMTKSMNKISRNSGHIGTTIYKAPEILMLDGVYSESIDIWSLACTFYYMVTYKDIFHESLSKSDIDYVKKIFEYFGTAECYDEYSSKLKLKQKNIEEILKIDSKKFDEASPYGKSDEFIKLLKKMLNVDPEKRCKITEVVQFFTDEHQAVKIPEIVKEFPYHHSKTKDWRIGVDYISENSESPRMERFRTSRSNSSKKKIPSSKKSNSKSKSRKRRNISKSSSSKRIGFENYGGNKSPTPDSLKAEYLFNKYDRLMKDKPKKNKKKTSLTRRNEETRKSSDWRRVSLFMISKGASKVFIHFCVLCRV